MMIESKNTYRRTEARLRRELITRKAIVDMAMTIITSCDFSSEMNILIRTKTERKEWEIGESQISKSDPSKKAVSARVPDVGAALRVLSEAPKDFEMDCFTSVAVSFLAGRIAGRTAEDIKKMFPDPIFVGGLSPADEAEFFAQPEFADERLPGDAVRFHNDYPRNEGWRKEWTVVVGRGKFVAHGTPKRIPGTELDVAKWIRTAGRNYYDREKEPGPKPDKHVAPKIKD